MSSSPWQCGWCQASFRTRAEAAAHLRGHHAQSDACFVTVDAVTWTKDAHDLFDKEAGDDQKVNTKILLPAPTQANPVLFARKNDTVQAIRSTTSRLDGGEKLHVELGREENSGLLGVARTPKSGAKQTSHFRSKMMWRVVDRNGWSLQEGDVMRFGRARMSVVQICLAGDPMFPNLHPGSEDDAEEGGGAIPVAIVNCSNMLEHDDFSAPSETRCRICLGDLADVDEEGPMIQAPCLCKGSNGRVHTGCLQDWLATKYGLEDRDNDGQYFSYKPPVCDVCKTEFPVVVSLGHGPDAEQTSLIRGLTKITPPFIVFSLPRSNDSELNRPNGERYIFAPNQPSAVLKIGRGNEAQADMNDVSVSRLHSMISFADGAFKLKDNGARFQTMIRPTRPEVLGQSLDPVQVQCGRTVLTFSMEEECISQAQIPNADQINTEAQIWPPQNPNRELQRPAAASSRNNQSVSGKSEVNCFSNCVIA